MSHFQSSVYPPSVPNQHPAQESWQSTNYVSPLPETLGGHNQYVPLADGQVITRSNVDRVIIIPPPRPRTFRLFHWYPTGPMSLYPRHHPDFLFLRCPNTMSFESPRRYMGRHDVLVTLQHFRILEPHLPYIPVSDSAPMLSTSDLLVVDGYLLCLTTQFARRLETYVDNGVQLARRWENMLLLLGIQPMGITFESGGDPDVLAELIAMLRKTLLGQELQAVAFEALQIGNELHGYANLYFYDFVDRVAELEGMDHPTFPVREDMLGVIYPNVTSDSVREILCHKRRGIRTVEIIGGSYLHRIEEDQGWSMHWRHPWIAQYPLLHPPPSNEWRTLVPGLVAGRTIIETLLPLLCAQIPAHGNVITSRKDRAGIVRVLSTFFDKRIWDPVTSRFSRCESLNLHAERYAGTCLRWGFLKRQLEFRSMTLTRPRTAMSWELRIQ